MLNGKHHNTMKYIVLGLFMTSLFLLSCDEYKPSPSISPDYISSLNKTLSEGQQHGASWANSPEEIGRHFFPPVSHDGGPKLYEVKKEIKSATDYVVIILEEGAIDDEVSGEKHTIHFQDNNGHWTIGDLKLEIKRRH